jgi:ribosome biogenesis GTPase
VVIDTPGMRELGLESADVAKAFADVDELAKSCRYRDCAHKGERACAVQKAIDDGTWTRRGWKTIISSKRGPVRRLELPSD